MSPGGPVPCGRVICFFLPLDVGDNGRCLSPVDMALHPKEFKEWQEFKLQIVALPLSAETYVSHAKSEFAERLECK